MSAIFVTGPVRSGKSEYAARLALQSGARVTFVATAARDASDAEWTARIARHEADRPADWATIESATVTPDALIAALAGAERGSFWIFDALGTWLATRLEGRSEAELDAEAARLADALLAFSGTIAVVGEQVGWDIVPERASARLFRDVLGRMERRIATRAERALLLVSGIAVELKP